jgi:hypothetical protein
MVLASGSGLIEDVRRAPEDVLSMIEPRNEVRQCEKPNGKSILIRILVPSTEIHTRLVEPGGQIQRGHNPIKINSKYCSYF